MRSSAMARRLAFYAGAAAGVLLISQFVFQTPAARLYRGFVLGMLASLTAVGLVLLYRTLRIFNFAQVAVGTAGGALTFSFMQYTRVPFLISFSLGLLLAGLTGFAMGLIALRFAKAPRLILTVVTLVAAFLILSIAPLVQNLPFFPDVDTLAAFEQLGSGQFRNRIPLAGLQYQIGGLAFPLGFGEILAIEVSLLGLLAVGAFFRFTRAGTAARGIAENAERASLLGIGVGALSLVVWTLTGVLSGASVIIAGILTTPQSAIRGGGGEVILAAMVAAVIGKMRNIPLTAAAAVAIGVLNEGWDWKLASDQAAFQAVLFVVLVLGLFLQRSALARSELQAETSSWVAAQEARPIPTQMAALPAVRAGRLALASMGLVALGIFPFVVDTGPTVLGSVVAINAIVVLSIVVLTGWAGQASLGQYAFVAIGAAVGGALSTNLGLPFWLAIPIASVVVAGLAAVVGLPALRVPGLFLIVVTFAFGVAIPELFFQPRYVGWLVPDGVQRPSFFLLDFDDERSMYYLCVGALLMSIVVVRRLRRTKLGRLLIAVRENEASVRSFGVSVVWTKIWAFAFAGGLAGFAGAVFAYQQRGFSPDSFEITRSIDAFQQAVFGGVASIPGALLGSAYFRVVGLSSSPITLILLGPLTTLALLYSAPGGLVSLLLKARDGLLRVIAQRRQMVVPALFPELDETALRSRRWPLSEATASAGLAAMNLENSYALRSLLRDDTKSENGKVERDRIALKIEDSS